MKSPFKALQLECVAPYIDNRKSVSDISIYGSVQVLITITPVVWNEGAQSWVFTNHGSSCY